MIFSTSTTTRLDSDHLACQQLVKKFKFIFAFSTFLGQVFVIKLNIINYDTEEINRVGPTVVQAPI